MKIVVIGGAGLIGSQLVGRLRREGHEVVAASRSTGVDVLTGAGLAEALDGARVLVDVSNAPSFEDRAVLEFFETAGRRLLAGAAEAGVAHYVALSVVGTERMLASGYFRAKLAQEDLIRASGLPYTIVRATQFFEFADGIAEGSIDGEGAVRVPPATLQPIASADVAEALAGIATGGPRMGMVELAGPEPIRLDAFLARRLASRDDPRRVVADERAGYFGAPIDDRSLTPGDGPLLGATRFDAWLAARR